MEKIWVGAQLYLDNDSKDLPISKIERKISLAKELLGLNSLIIQVNINNKENVILQDNIIKICKKLNIRSYLWYSILADNQDYKVKKIDSIVNYLNKVGQGEIGRWDKLNIKEDDFLFICPNNTEVIEQIFNKYKNNLENHDYDGVFLDRIRYPSAANGFESLFTCFCKYCQKKYYDIYKSNIEDLKCNITNFIKFLENSTKKELENKEIFNSIWKSTDIDKFKYFKIENICDIVKKFSNYARLKNKEIGLDLFSYSIAEIVSQDYFKLSKYCDWIKPMIYCHTNAPAGIPLDLYCLSNAIKRINKNLTPREIIILLNMYLGINLPFNSFKNILEYGLNDNFFVGELEKLSKIVLKNNTKIYPGIETVQIPGISMINKKILISYIEGIFKHFRGFVLSWNLMNTPEIYFKIISKKLYIRPVFD